MKTEIDSSVLLDVLNGDAPWADRSTAALKRAADQGDLIISECVLVEIAPETGEAELATFLEDWQIVFVPSTPESARLAGRMYARYLERGGKRGRVVPDFLIGAHAMTLADRLLARAAGFRRDYFAGLQVIEP